MAVILAQAQEQSHLMESVRSIFAVKAYQQEAGRLSHWQNYHAKSLQQALGLQQTELGIGTCTVLVGGLELIVVIYLAAHGVLAGNFTVGMLFALLSYRGHFTQRLGSLVNQVLNVRAMSTHLERLADIWIAAPEVLPAQNGLPSSAALPVGKVAPLILDNVSFQHSPRSPTILQDANINIAPGEWITIVGPSGVGKTTVLKLFMGFTQPCAGQVRWGSRLMSPDVAQMLRRRSACVLQGDAFFSGTIIENITLYETPDLDRVNACLEAVGMLATVEQLPLKHLSVVGDLSSGLSTGQMQRLVFARALYRQPDYLFLDECTANLDQRSVSSISHLLQQLRCTRIVVSHDWALAERADSVYELSDGRLQALDSKSATAGYPE
jgi:ATP-binding cassette subfamily B protein RaxB